ncbi:cellulase family glycosylhydrolase [Algiphilus sp. W345]|uniref:cellulase n=1 Tax=Banduia mediterranea TaxID=3075609 RepID=A0ABU2WFD8_9GAMM|nr:cellulase family glycosylhydrolase [Algiphilus sp. W345]MDT0496571.1 cellulase family glycosylhydrolase [Algiphilus sp. W345]
MQQVKDLGFNAVRLPFVPKTLYSPLKAGEDLPTHVEPTLNAELIGKTPLEIMDLWTAEADRQHLYVGLDFHSISNVSQYFTWYSDDPSAYGEGMWAETHDAQAYSEDDWIRDLRFVAQRYSGLVHFIGIDPYNEPYGVVRWGPGDPFGYSEEADWQRAVERAPRPCWTPTRSC